MPWKCTFPALEIPLICQVSFRPLSARGINMRKMITYDTSCRFPKRSKMNDFDDN